MVRQGSPRGARDAGRGWRSEGKSFGGRRIGWYDGSVMTRQQWTQLIIILLFVGFSVLSWAFRQLREYQQKQAARQAAERRRMEVLRTGRADQPPAGEFASTRPAPAIPPQAPLDPHAEAPRRLQEPAQRRRAELEAMARRAAGGSGGGAPKAGPRTATPVPVQRTPQARGERPGTNVEQQRRAAEQARRRAEKLEKQDRIEAKRKAEQAKVVERQRAEADARQTAAEQQTAASAAADALGTGETGRAGRPALAAAIGAARLGPGATPATAEQWRRAIVLMNVLGPPAALRSDDQERREF